ncbi:MAG: CoA transferase [Rhodobacteraceae bacterium]|nr:CoA transferase [Paracoccaceae bacterium]
MTQNAPDKGPLDGVKVVERVGRLAGSVCAGRLADLGAEVCRVVMASDPLPNEPAEWRVHPFAASHGRLIDLDDTADATQQWLALAAEADIVIVTLPLDADGRANGAVLDGLDRDGQIICAVSPFGLTTNEPPLVDPSEAQMQAISGLLATTGDVSGRPSVVDVPVLEVFTGLNAATTAVAALRLKEVSGLGQLLDMAVFETCFVLTGTFLGKVLTGQAQGFRNGCRHPLVAPWNAYQTSDGWVILCTTNNQNWLDLVEIMGQPDLANAPDFATAAARIGNVQAVDVIVAQWAASVTTKQALEHLQSRGIPSGTVADWGTVAKSGTPVPCRRVPAFTSGAPVVSRAKEAPALPCSGVRILEIGPYTAGPLAGRFLGNMGAEVIKIEPACGEDSRLWVPMVDGISCYFANYNAGKKSVVLDLRNAAQKHSFLELVKTADVVMFNLKAGAMERMGMGADVLHRINPRLIYCGISGYGMNGSTRPALDTVIQAEAGVISRIVTQSGPNKAGFSIADLAAAHIAPLEIIAALRDARRSGTGTVLDISMYDTVAWMVGLSGPDGAPVLPPSTVVQALDGWVLVQGDAGEIQQMQNSSCAEVIRLMNAKNLAAVKMLELNEVYGLNVAKREGLMIYEHGKKRGNCVITAPYMFDKTPVNVSATVPDIGADTRDLIGPPTP